MDLTEERTKCRCGTAMETYPKTGKGKFCPNCDTTQPQEVFKFERRPTREDIRFNMYWLTQFDEYVDNTRQQDEPAESGENDSPGEEPEGDTNGQA